MLLTVEDFRARVADRLDGLVVALTAATGRASPEETDSWRRSLPVLADTLDDARLKGFHLYLDEGELSLEYRLPGSSGWCDAVLLGRNDDHPSALIIELKHWDTLHDRAGRYTGLVERPRFGEVSHPSDQVMGYVEYCRAFHSAVNDYGAEVSGCVYFTTNTDIGGYRAAPNDALVAEFPVFNARTAERAGVTDFMLRHLRAPDAEFATAFEQGEYRQPRALLRQASAAISHEKSPFVLIEQQRTAFAVAMAEVKEAMASGEKRVVIIEGPPGSGKSVVAARIWAALAKEFGNERHSVAMVGTSASQFSNWSAAFAKVTDKKAAAGFVLKANSFIPWTMGEVKHAKGELGVVWQAADHWETNLRTAAEAGMPPPRRKDNEIGVAIVDEAHALVNPEHKVARGVVGYSIVLGPQAYHIIRGSKVAVFLVDPAQGFRDKESTSVTELETWAKALGAKVTKRDLSGHQFRCGGSVEYTQWVEGLLAGAPAEVLRPLTDQWHHAGDTSLMLRDRELGGRRYRPRAPRRMAFKMFDDPKSMEDALRERIAEGRSARLLASFAVPWISEDDTSPHSRLPDARDFRFELPPGSYATHWSKIWNVTPKREVYTHFVMGLPGGGSRIHEDPLSEVGCPYAVRGFDFDYVGILWLGDLFWDGNCWDVDLDHVEESGLNQSVRAARRNAEARAHLLEKIAQAYRILLTRPIHGAYMWAADPATRARIAAALGPEG